MDRTETIVTKTAVVDRAKDFAGGDAGGDPGGDAGAGHDCGVEADGHVSDEHSVMMVLKSTPHSSPGASVASHSQSEEASQAC